ncbi:MAG: hypothetical protein HYS81_04880 [Candidatus Aenigmatarchaeota archaeon]|nr:MAG: hypothetical protein HYS81_04880 [Candidatus Aenigmarchaeota archaeon]
MSGIPQDVKQLVIYRLDSLPANKKISIGSYGEFSKEELIENVKKENEIGKKIVEIELEFLRAMKEGLLA